MSAAPIDIDFVVARRPAPEAPPAFCCRACNRTIRPSPWPYDRHEEPPICGSCTRHWSRTTRLGLTGATRGDMRTLHRLSACITLIEWEARNGSKSAL